MALVSWGVIAEKISGLSAMACLDVTKAGDGSQKLPLHSALVVMSKVRANILAVPTREGFLTPFSKPP